MQTKTAARKAKTRTATFTSMCPDCGDIIETGQTIYLEGPSYRRQYVCRLCHEFDEGLRTAAAQGRC